MAASDPKAAPGIVRMKCMIWEPTPICDRRRQEDVFVFNEVTLKHVPTVKPDATFEFIQDPPSFYLKPKHVYRDTFLQVDGENLETNKDKFRTTRMEPIFDTFAGRTSFTRPWMFHQTFNLIGSVFNKKYLKPSEYKKGDVDQKGRAKFAYQFRNVTPCNPGVAPIQNSAADNPDDEFSDNVPTEAIKKIVDELKAATPPPTATDEELTAKVTRWWEERKAWRIFPSQLRATDEPLVLSNTNLGGTTGSTGSTTTTENDGQPRAIHWLVEKAQPLFNKQDFWVEFIRQAYAPDISPTNIPIAMVPGSFRVEDGKPHWTPDPSHEYKYIDPTYPPEPGTEETENRPLIVNECVAEIGTDGNPILDANSTVSISRQPYYMVEVGHSDENHRYIILLAYNSYPIFVHIGKFGTISFGTGGTDSSGGSCDGGFECSITEATPLVIKPTTPISRRLSVYDRTCKELMDQETLRITVRNHLGSIIIYFNDDVSRPWIINRTDLDVDAVSPQASIGDMPRKSVDMRVPEGPIRIGAGNILCGFMYGPLHYNTEGRIAMPDSICVKGPVESNEVNCYLREKESRKIGAKQQPRFFQEAEVYQEVVKGVQTGLFRVATLDPSTTPPNRVEPEQFLLSGYSKQPAQTRKWQGSINVDLPTNKDEGRYSYIRIKKTSKLSTIQNPVGGGNPDDESGGQGAGGAGAAPTTETIKFFRAEYTLGVGDVTVGKESPNLFDDTKWTIPACMTPIATGWTLLVPKSDTPRWVCPIFDAAHHVLNFSSQWSFSDMVKVEHSGTIKFLINFGDMTGTDPAARNTPIVGCGGNEPEPYKIDRSAELASLVDRTFMLRIYAWWEDGYMACTRNECWCKRDQSPNGANSNNTQNRSVIFTGLCHGGQITVEAGRRVMECQLLDYWKILEDQQFLNSPFFDGMRDFNAVHEVLDLAGFYDGGGTSPSDKWAPGNFIKAAANVPKGIIPSFADQNGDVYWLQDYALPSAFDVLQSPILRFNDTDKYSDAIIKFANFSGKMVYFDRYGVFKMVPRPDQYFCARGHPMFLPKCNFFASPADIPANACSGYDSLAFTSYSYRRGVADTVNEIHIISTTPNGELIIGSGVNLPAKYNPNTPGYAGYTKRLLQVDGIFGSLDAVQNVVKYYSGFYIPPVMVSWESKGNPRLMAGDIVTFTGLQLDDAFPPKTRDDLRNLPEKTTAVYITNLATEITLNDNTHDWVTRYDGEWIFTGQLDCGATTGGQ